MKIEHRLSERKYLFFKCNFFFINLNFCKKTKNFPEKPKFDILYGYVQQNIYIKALLFHFI